MVTSALLLMRLTLSQEELNDVFRTLLMVVALYAIASSMQTGLKTQSET